MIRTFAPSEMHWSACVFCFCGSPCAFTTRAGTPAALNALMSDGLSNCSHRTDVFVSGIKPQTWIPAAFLPVAAVAPLTAAIAATPITRSNNDLLKFLFTCPLLRWLPTGLRSESLQTRLQVSTVPVRSATPRRPRRGRHTPVLARRNRPARPGRRELSGLRLRARPRRPRNRHRTCGRLLRHGSTPARRAGRARASSPRGRAGGSRAPPGRACRARRGRRRGRCTRRSGRRGPEPRTSCPPAHVDRFSHAAQRNGCERARMDVPNDVLRFADVVLDEGRREVFRGGTRIELTATEFNLLRYFLPE